MARKKKNKYADYFGNRFDLDRLNLGDSFRRFNKNNSRLVLALGLTFGMSALGGLGYLVFSGSTPEIEQATQPYAPIEQEFAQSETFEAPVMAALPIQKEERIQKNFTAKKKKIANKKAQAKKALKKTGKTAKVKKASQNAAMICINPALLKTNKKARIAKRR